MARPSPPAATTTPSGCGTSRAGAPSAHPSPATPALSTAWRSAPTARPSPPAATTTPCDCGASPTELRHPPSPPAPPPDDVPSRALRAPPRLVIIDLPGCSGHGPRYRPARQESCSFSAGAVDFVAPRLSQRRPSREGGSHEVHAADPSGGHPDAAVAGGVGNSSGGGAEGRVRRLPGDQPDPGRHPRPRAGRSGDGNHRAGPGRQDADHRRPVRRDQGVDRRLPPVRGRRPRRCDRAGLADPGGAPGWRRRGASDRGVVAILEQVFRDQWGRVLAALIGFLGDFDLAEEAAQEAFAIAAERWPRDGVPTSPGAWLVTTARNRAINRIRRDRTLAAKIRLLQVPEPAEDTMDATTFPDERLELIFTCCHPALGTEAQVALTLRTLGGLSTGEIARAFLVPEPTMAQRLVRAKAKIRDARIPYQVPPTDALAERLEAVMVVVYLVFNEGYAASFGARLVRHELCEEAIRLGRMLVELLPAQAEPKGLLALMLLHDSRRETRLDGSGDIVLLEDQDRARWDRAQIDEGAALVEAALRAGGRPPGAYALQAAIAAIHAQAPTAAATDWGQIAALYGVLTRVHPSPVIELNRAVAVAMAGGLERGLALVDEVDHRGELGRYHLLPAARAELLRRLGRHRESAESYQRALALVSNEAERRHLEKRLREIMS